MGVCCVLLVFLDPDLSFGQENKVSGSVQNRNNDISNVLVVNLNSKRSTITDSLGRFTLEAKLRDSIRFSAVQFRTKEIVVTTSMLGKDSLQVTLIEDVINLSEVVVTPYNLSGKIAQDLKRLDLAPTLNAKALGLPKADVVPMTYGERLLIEADRGKYVRYYGIALTINTHKLLNRLSGRTGLLEARVARDADLRLEKEIIAKFSKKTISDGLGIAESDVDAFLTFCISQEGFSALSQAENNILIWEYLQAKSLEFKRYDLPKEYAGSTKKY